MGAKNAKPQAPEPPPPAPAAPEPPPEPPKGIMKQASEKILAATVGGAKVVGTAVVDGTKAVGTGLENGATFVDQKIVAPTGKAIGTGLDVTFKTLGVAAGFQAVFGEGIDKSDAGLEAAFEKVDTDKSGKLSAAEMKAYILSMYPKGLEDQVIDEMMAAADTDGDGEIDLSEFKVIMRAGPKKSDGAIGGAVDAGVGATVGGVKAVGDGAAVVGTATFDGAKAGVSAVSSAVVDGAKAVATGLENGATFIDEKIVVPAAKAIGDGVKATGKFVRHASNATGVTAGLQAVFGENIDKSDEGLEAAFAKVDTDEDGKINTAEMKAYILSLYSKGYPDGLDDQKIGEMIAAADTNKDGKMSIDEFKVIMRAGPKQSDGAIGGAVDASIAATVGGVKATGDGAAYVGNATLDGAKAVGTATINGAVYVGTAVVDGANNGATFIDEKIVTPICNLVGDGVKVVGDSVVNGAKAVGDKVGDGVKAAGSLVSPPGSPKPAGQHNNGDVEPKPPKTP